MTSVVDPTSIPYGMTDLNLVPKSHTWNTANGVEMVPNLLLQCNNYSSFHIDTVHSPNLSDLEVG